MTNKITLPPLPNRALRPGAGDDAMTDYARAAVLLDRQQRAAPTYGSIAERAADGKDAGLWQAAPSAKPFGFLTPSSLEWDQRQSEKVVKLTRSEQPKHGFMIPLYTIPPAPSAEPQSVEAQSAEWLLSQCEEYQRRAHEAEREVVRLRSSTPPDHTALLRQALEALEERYIGALRDNAIDALRAALEGK
jgi:hypothetical protein